MGEMDTHRRLDDVTQGTFRQPYYVGARLLHWELAKARLYAALPRTQQCRPYLVFQGNLQRFEKFSVCGAVTRPEPGIGYSPSSHTYLRREGRLNKCSRYQAVDLVRMCSERACVPTKGPTLRFADVHQLTTRRDCSRCAPDCRIYMAKQTAIHVTRWTPDSFLDGVDVVQIPKPQPAAGEAVIRFTLRPVNPTDLVTLRGIRRHSQTLPLVPGSEGTKRYLQPGLGISLVTKALCFGLEPSSKPKSSVASPARLGCTSKSLLAKLAYEHCLTLPSVSFQS